MPVQKLSAEAYKEQMANVGKTLTALGSYWKGRKPLILAKACVLGCLLPATDDPVRDLEIFEKLMAMDDESFVVRWKRRPKPKEILGKLSIACITDYFIIEPEDVLPMSELEEMMNEYIHLRQQARNVFEMRYQETIDPDKDRWELCSRVLARRDVVDRLSVPW